MPSKRFDSFPNGLDTRRSVLTSQPGTLAVLNNGHVNQGAEIEKRKAFVALPLPAGTFGLDVLANSLVVYGSQPDPGGEPNNVVYQQLIAPTGANMTAVVSSTVFGGKTFVIASYDDGSLYTFYDTVLVIDFVAGTNDIDFTSPATIAAGLVPLINRTAGYTATLNGNSFTVTAAIGNNFTPSIVLKTTAGTITPTLISTAIASFGQVGASGSFQIVKGQSGFASGVLNGNKTNVSNGNFININGTIYTFRAVPTVAGEVARGTTAALSITNLVAAINGDGFNVANPVVTAAVGVSGYTINLTAIVAGAGSNAYFTTTTNSAGWAFANATLVNGNANAITSVAVGVTNLLNGGTAIPMGATTSLTAIAVVASINANVGVGFTAVATGSIVTITATTLGVALNDSVLSVTVNDGIMIGQCGFWLQGSGFVTKVTAAGTDLISGGGTLTFPAAGATLALFNAAIVANINANVGTGYTAYTDGTLIYVAQRITTSADAPIVIEVVVTSSAGKNGTVVIPSGSIIQLSPSVTVANLTSIGSGGYRTPTLIITASGGTGTYTYQWTLTGFPAGLFPATIQTPKAARTTITWYVSFGSNPPFTALATCQVSDSAGNISQVNITIVFAGE